MPRLARRSCLLFALVALAGCAARPAAQPAEPAPLRGRLVEGDRSPLLETSVPPFTAVDAPLAQVLDDLASKTGVMIVANYPAMEVAGVDRQTPVRLSAPRPLPLGQVLDLVLGQAGGGFVTLVAQERDGVVTVSTRDAGLAQDRRVGLYPVTALLADMRRAAAAFPDARASTRPASDAIVPGAAADLAADSAEARLLSLLSDLFADPETKGPPRMTARLETGVLIVEATPADHARVGQFLTLLRDTLRGQLQSAGKS